MTPKVGATLPKTNTSHPSIGTLNAVLVAQKLNKELVSSTRISVEHLSLETSILFGISSSPVSNNPGPVRRRSSLIIRHSSLSQHMLPTKYKPTSDKSKVLFFLDKENAYGVLRTEVIIIPRDWVLPTAEEFPLGADSTMDNGVLPMEELLSKEKEEVHTDGFCSWAVTFYLFKQGLLVKILVSLGVIKSHHFWLDVEHLQEAIQNVLICAEMVFFSVMQQYAYHLVPYSGYVEAMLQLKKDD
ncbi:hypothetical protein KY289_003123 [Solanum tuberosum]|nr:hypothetical protein KY289_003123 [Solanum tuberosum]